MRSWLFLPLVIAFSPIAGCWHNAGAFLVFENGAGKELHLSTKISPYREIVVRANGSETLRLPMENAGPSDYFVKDKSGKLLGKMTAKYISQFYDQKSDTYRVPIVWE